MPTDTNSDAFKSHLEVANEAKAPQIEGKNKITWRAASTLFGAWVVNLIIGAQLAMGNIAVYFTSYYRMSLGYDIDSDMFFPMQSMIVVFAMFIFPLGNRLVDMFGGESRPVVALGGAIAISMVSMCAYLRFSPKVFMLMYALGMGIFKGLLQSAILRAGWSHLPERKGLVSGCIISGFGFGGFFFGLYVPWLCNPHGLNYELDPTDGHKYLPSAVGNRVPFALKILCLTWSCQIIFGLLTISNYQPPKEQPELHKNINDSYHSGEGLAEAQQPEVDDDFAAKNTKLRNILMSSKFFTIYFLAVCHLFYGYFFTNVYKDYGKEYINDDKFLSWVGAISALCNGCFKVFWATMLDYYPFKRVYGCLIGLALALIILINYAVYNKWLFFLASCLTFMCDGALTSMLPALTVAQFGILRGP